MKKKILGIPSMRIFHFKTKDMKKIINSKWWNDMHQEIAIKYCDYPNHDCTKIKEYPCEECEIYKLKNPGGIV